MSDECYKSLPKKRMAAGAVLFNLSNEILIVKPSYRDDWLFPGGIIEDDESPREACIREVKEEIGLNIPQMKLMCVDYIALEKFDSIQFVFNAAVLSDEQIGNIKVDGKEIVDFKFCSVADVLPLLNDYSRERLPKVIEAINSNTTVYLEHGKFV